MKSPMVKDENDTLKEEKKENVFIDERNGIQNHR